MWFGAQPVVGGSLQTVIKTLDRNKALICPFFLSVFKINYRFHVHEWRLKMKTKGCLRSTNSKTKSLVIVPSIFSQNLWGLAHGF